MGRIAILTEELINQIAAGEVVERPASVVKELAENALDAGARTIRVTLSEGGLSLVMVQDDGVGMPRDDAALCLARHATSKLRSMDGLSAISTKGFRGEALSAIASVSRLTLISAEPDSSVGTQVYVEGGAIPRVSDAPPLPGTTVRVEDLFFNTPGRRKFMKRPQTELVHSQEALIRLALAHHDVGFFLEHEGRRLFTSPAGGGDPSDRIAAAFGTEIRPHLLPVEERQLGVTVVGHLAAPEFNLPNARGIYTFVNRRYIRDRGINHAIQQALRDLLPAGRQPVAILLIETDPRTVDVNVHPQKLEVRFAAPRQVYDAVFAGVRGALHGPALRPTAPGRDGEMIAGASYALAVKDFLARAQQAAWGAPLPLSAVGEAPMQTGLALPRDALGPSRQAWPQGYFSSLRYLGSLGRRFLICEGAGGTLIALDPHAALERVRLSELRASVRNGNESTQRCLFASSVELDAADVRTISRQLPLLQQVGLEVDHFGGNTFVVKSAPSGLMGVDFLQLLRELASTWRASKSDAKMAALQLFACHAASQRDRALSGAEIQALFQQLEQADFEPPCRHGQVVVMEIPILEIERRAGR
jgi:DNA mismatch repair protein MutL